MRKKFKIIKFNPILFKKKLKEIWQRWDFYLDFEKEWKNFLDICGNNKIERIFSLNNFLITEFLITYCGSKSKMLSSMNCYCGQRIGEIKILNEDYNQHRELIKEFLVNFN